MKFLKQGTLLDKFKAKIRGTIDIDRLIKNGLVVGNNFHAQEGVIIDPGHCWLIEIGNNVTLAPRCHVLAHDASTKYWLGYTKVGTVKIGNNVFIGAGTVILPGSYIDDNVIIGAGSLVKGNVPSGVYFGNPLHFYCSLEEYLMKEKDKMKTSPLFGEEYVIGKISKERKSSMVQKLTKTIGYIR